MRPVEQIPNASDPSGGHGECRDDLYRFWKFVEDVAANRRADEQQKHDQARGCGAIFPSASADGSRLRLWTSQAEEFSEEEKTRGKRGQRQKIDPRLGVQ